jgi:hypothetical protein
MMVPPIKGWPRNGSYHSPSSNLWKFVRNLASSWDYNRLPNKNPRRPPWVWKYYLIYEQGFHLIYGEHLRTPGISLPGSGMLFSNRRHLAYNIAKFARFFRGDLLHLFDTDFHFLPQSRLETLHNFADQLPVEPPV